MSAGAIGASSSPAMQPLEEFQGPEGRGFGELSSQQFTQIMMQALTNQDPLEPNDTSEILEQISSLRNIEGQQNLQEKLEELVLQNQLSEASSLIGRMAEGLNEQMSSVQGLVTSVRVVDGDAMLELDTGQTLPMENVERVWLMDEPGEAATGTADGEQGAEASQAGADESEQEAGAAMDSDVEGLLDELARG